MNLYIVSNSFYRNWTKLENKYDFCPLFDQLPPQASNPLHQAKLTSEGRTEAG